MTKHELTGQIKAKGWQVSFFLDYIGRSYPWYHNNCNGDEKQILRLRMLVKALPDFDDLTSPERF